MNDFSVLSNNKTVLMVKTKKPKSFFQTVALSTNVGRDAKKFKRKKENCIVEGEIYSNRS
jgi:hypothetical protein